MHTIAWRLPSKDFDNFFKVRAMDLEYEYTNILLGVLSLSRGSACLAIFYDALPKMSANSLVYVLFYI